MLSRCFGSCYRLGKSCIYGVDIDPNEVEMFARIVNCNVGSFPFTYLGLPVGKGMHKSEAWGEDEKGMVWISWKKTIASRDMGGLGVGNLRAKNLSLLGKWRWRFLKEKCFMEKGDSKYFRE
ncbi:hypothetical protein CTI12_AA226660 [Artemisia annua]|uniref:RNA-directed DNA polymerase, eukaryota, Reverse transcriptase zinc-binding domain protein n=1 Tax=Artemisia annua TaxID=35608 RepID=A0A2U1NUI1_ARTAN|nr:hypothetical protein CTI12_AA226660 [Artemisia annua]